jgi:hypothetical protein
MRESCIRKRLRLGMERAGGELVAVRQRGARHFPDDLAIWPDGEIEIVEEKAPGKKPRAGQVRCHKRLAALNVRVHVVSTPEEVDKFLRRGNASAQCSSES